MQGHCKAFFYPYSFFRKVYKSAVGSYEVNYLRLTKDLVIAAFYGNRVKKSDLDNYINKIVGSIKKWLQ
jgi:hypothetical protein